MKLFSQIKSVIKSIGVVLSMLLPSIAIAADEMPDRQSIDNADHLSSKYSSDENAGFIEDADSLYFLYFPKAEFHSDKIEEVTDAGMFQRAPEFQTVDTYVPSLVYVDSDYVGGIPVESGVSPTGARTYNIPLRIPDGVNGMTPSISLAYNSQGPNSIMGPGWSISGLPVIIRAGKSIYYDGISDAIRNDTTDAFFLDGVRMIKISGGNGHIDYDTEFGNIKARGYIYRNDISYFDIYYPDGRTATFIQKHDSANATYHISTEKDLWGNTITFHYDYINDCWTLARIGYSDYEITFTYSRRKLSVSGFRGGVFLPENNILKEIAIGRRGQSPHLYYTLEYTLRGNFQLLSTIRLWNENDDYTPALTMFYGTGQTREGWTESKSRLTQWYSTTNPNSINICLGRMDGQGGSEAVVVYPRCEPYYKNLDPSIPGTKCTLINMYNGNEKIIVYPEISYPMSLTSHTIETGKGFTDLFCADLNGSGSDMLVKVNSNFASEGIKRMDRITFTTYEWSPGAFLAVRHTRNYDIPIKWMTDNPNFTIPLYFFPGDYDGDGKAEIMAMSSNYPLGYTHLPSKCYIFDLEGDSIKYEGHIIDFDVTFTGVDLPDPTVAIGRSDRLYAMDFDGDGKTDFVHINTTGTDIYTFDVTESGLTPRKLGTHTRLTREKTQSANILSGDFNGDGLADLMLSPAKTSTLTYQNAYLSKGDGTIGESQGISVPDKAAIPIAHDVDHDGKTDVVYVSGTKILTHIQGTPATSINSEGHEIGNAAVIPVRPSSKNRFSNLVVFRDSVALSMSWRMDKSIETLLTGLSSGNGVVEKTTYAKLNEPSLYVDGIRFYQAGGECRFPYYRFCEATAVVAATEKISAGESIGKTCFSYAGGVAHRQGLGFRGFSTFRRHNAKGDIEVMEFDPVRFCVPVAVSTSRTQINYDYSVSVKPDRIPVVNLDTKVERDLLTGFSTITDFHYDDYGNITHKCVDYGDGVLSTTDYTYINNPTAGDGYRIGFQSEVGEKIYDAKVSISKTMRVNTHDRYKPVSVSNWINGGLVESRELSYDTRGNTISQAVRPYSSTKKITTTFTYDSLGHLTSEKSPTGIKTSYQYNSFGLLTKITEGARNGTEYTYDGFDRVVAETKPDGTKRTLAYSWIGDPADGHSMLTETETGKPEIITTKDPLGRDTRISEIRFDGRRLVTDYEYDSYGRLVSESLPYIEGGTKQNISYSYDIHDRLIQKKIGGTALGSEWSYNRNTVTETTNGISIKRTHNPRGELIQSEDDGGIIKYTLAPDGLPIKVIAPGMVATTFGYDSFRRRISLDDPSSGHTEWTYDDSGNLASQTDANGNTTTFKYDSYGRLSKKIYPEFTVSYFYNSHNEPISILTNQYSGETISYDSSGRIASRTFTTGRSFSISGNIHSFGDGLMAFGVGAVAGGLGGFAGGWAFSAAGGMTLGGGGFIAGAASGAIATAVEVQTQNIGNHLFSLYFSGESEIHTTV